MKKIIVLFAGLCLLARGAVAQTCSVNAGVPASVCVSADSFILSGNASGALATSPAWRFVSGPNVPVITDSTSASTSVKGFVAGTYIFRYGARCSDASDVADSVSITVDALPVFTAGADTFICGRSMNMNATLPPGASGQWSPVSKVSIGTGSSPSSSFSVNSYDASCPKSYDAVWTVTQGACSAKDTVNVGYGTEASSMPVLADQMICGTSFQGRIYYHGCGGNLNVTQLSGPLAATVVYPFGTPSSSAYSLFRIDGMTTGTYVFAVDVLRCSGGTFKDTFQLTVGSSVEVSNPGYRSKYLCVDQFDSVYYFDPASSLLAGETITWNLTPSSKLPASLPDPVADTTGNILRISKVLHPDSSTTQRSYDYTYRYTVSNGTCSTTNRIVLTLYSPLKERAFQSVINLPCGTTATNIAIPVSGSVSDYAFRELNIISKPAGAADPAYSSLSYGRLDLSGLEPGKYVFSFVYSRGGEIRCGTNPVSVEVNVSQTPGLSNAGTDQVLPCGVDSSVLAGNTPLPGQKGTWQLVSGPSTVILTNPNAASLLIKNLSPGIYRFRWVISYGTTCAANYDEMQVVITPMAPSTNAGPDQTVCYGYPVPLSGTPFGTGTMARWRQIGGPAVTIADSMASATSISGTTASNVYTFAYTLANVCGSSTDTVVVTTTASQGPSAAVVTTADTCIMMSAVTLNAIAATSGSGMWSQLSGPSAATIASPASNNTAVSGLVGGAYQFLWTVGQAGCDTLSDTVSVAYQSTAFTANAGSDRFVCQDSIHLAADTPALGSGIWSQLTGVAAAMADSSSPLTAVNRLLPGAYDFRWIVSLGVCPADSDEVRVVVSTPPSAANAMKDTAICGLNLGVSGRINLPIMADTPAAGTGNWGIMKGPYGFAATPGIANPGDANTTVSMIGGYYQLLWAISSGDCAPSYDTVNIDLVPQADAGPQTVELCEKSSYNLQGTEAGSGTVQWSQISGPATATITRPDNEFTTVTDLVPGTYRFRYAVVHPIPACNSVDTLTLTNSLPVPANAGPDTTFCWMPGGTILYLQADTPSSGIGRWFRSSGTGRIVYSPNDNSNPANATVTDAGLHQFRWTVQNGGCQTFDYKDVLAERIVVPPIDFNPLTVCKDSFTVSVSSPYTDYNYAWAFRRARIADTAGLNLTGPITNNFKVRDTNNIYLTITNPVTGCSAKDSTEIIVSCAYLPLPLTLLSFKAYKKGAWVLLQWDVAAEKNIRNYVVERSGDGRNWKGIKVLTARNISIRSQYNFTDQQPLRGLNLYRLKINEYDERNSYSAVRTVNIDGSGPQLLVYPNPAAAEIRVLWNSDNDAAYLLMDGIGRVMLEGRLTANTDNRIDISSVPTGYYLLKVISDNTEVGTQKVQIHR